MWMPIAASVSIKDDSGVRYIFLHFSALAIAGIVFFT